MKGAHPLKVWVDRKLNPGEGDSQIVDSFIITLIAFNVGLVIVETEPTIGEPHAHFFHTCEVISTVFFTVEYAARVWVANLQERYRHPFWGRLRYALTLMALVDMIAILPFYLHLVGRAVDLDARIARAIRLMRLLRVLKMGRYAHAVRTLTNVVKRKTEELTIASFVSVLVLILCSSAMYFAENHEQPEAFRSIPESMWWATVTLTSVGYGDVSPVTAVGKIIGAIVCLLGVMAVALPTGILASGFLEEMREQRRGKDIEVFGFCPHCGKQLIPGEELE